MAKKKQIKALSFLQPQWLTTLFFGIALGNAREQIPQVRAITNEIIRPSEPSVKQQSHNPGYPVSSFHIHRPGYSFAYHASRYNPAWVHAFNS